mmetsp:Transcript_6570/g.7178  ORF Transcript_6570/g.7178 Transcript_6570/m.7178 type:complete len:132 (+) Transcript_6570:2-397(+)
MYVKVRMNGRLIGKWRYRAWKTLWLISAVFFDFVAIWAAFRTFGGLGSVLKAILSSFFTLFFRFSLSFQVNLDLLRIMTFTIFFFEGLELFSMVVLILGPKVAPKMFQKLQLMGREPHRYSAVPDPSDGDE